MNTAFLLRWAEVPIYNFIASMLIGFLALLELLLESGPPGPKLVPHGRPVKQTNKCSSKQDFSHGFLQCEWGLI